MIDHLRNTLMNMVTRGKVIANAVLLPGRAVLAMSGLFGERMQGVELMQPYGMSSRPTAGDTIFVQVGGTRDHLVALHCDDPALRIADLQPGEFGFRDLNGQQVVWRIDRLEVTTPLKVVVNSTGEVDVTAPTVNVVGNIVLHGDLTMTGTASITGNLTMGGTGTITTPGQITSSFGAGGHLP